MWVLEKGDGELEAVEVDVAGAEKLGAAVADFVLQGGVVAELLQVVGGEGVAQDVLYPAEGEVAMESPPALRPAARADAPGVRASGR